MRRILTLIFGLMLASACGNAVAQETNTLKGLRLPGLNSFAAPKTQGTLAESGGGRIVLSAKLSADGPDISLGLSWSIFAPEPGPDGKLPLVGSAEGGTSPFDLKPGEYLMHVAYGRAGATKRIVVTKEPRNESIVLDAGGMKLGALLPGGGRIPQALLKFAIYDAREDAKGEQALILPNVTADTIVRLNAGSYHVVSTYGDVNAVIRSDIRVEAGKLTEAKIEHRAAQVTLKLVREAGGEAIADTAWAVLTSSGDSVRETVGAFASMVLAEGVYSVVAKNRERIYQREFEVVAGRNADIEVLTSQAAEAAAPAAVAPAAEGAD